MAKKNYKKLLERSRALAEDLRRFSFFAGTEQGKRFDELKAEALDLLDGKIVPELASSLTLPLFVAVLGGTNTGKSTVFNALAGVLLSETKITAGATKHPLVYVHQRWEKELLEGQVFDRIRCERLESPGQLLCVYDEPRMFFSFHDRKELKDVAFIDSPDFDSSEPHNRETAHKVLTQADVCLFLTTPQKYKDRVLVEDLETIAGQQKRVLVIFNLVADEMLFRTMADDLKVRVGDKVAFGGYLPDTEHKDPERALRERVNGIVDGFLKGLKRAEIKEATLHQGLRSLIARVRRLVESYKAEAGRKDDIIAEIAAQRKNVLTEYRRDFALGFPELSEALRRRMRSYEVRRLIPGTAGRKTGWLGLVHHATGLVGSRLTGAFAQTLEGEHRPADWERFQQKRDNDDLLRVKQLGQLLRARVDNHLRARASTSALCLSLLKDFFDQEGLERFDETVEGAYRAALAAEPGTGKALLDKTPDLDAERATGEKVAGRTSAIIANSVKAATGIGLAAATNGFGIWDLGFFPLGFAAGGYGVALTTYGVLKRQRELFLDERTRACARALDGAFLAPLRERVESVASEADLAALEQHCNALEQEAA